MHTRAYNLYGVDVSECVCMSDIIILIFFSLIYLKQTHVSERWWSNDMCEFVCARKTKIIPFFECGFNFAAIYFCYFGILAQPFHVIEQWVFDCRADTYRSTASQCVSDYV